MAKATYNVTLEYAANTLEFWLTDDAGVPAAFNPGTEFRVERIDDASVVSVWSGTSDEVGHIRFEINPLEGVLYKDGDSITDYDKVTYEHVYSLRDTTAEVYLRGKLNLVKVA